MRVLVGAQTDDLGVLYAPPTTPWLRLNFVSTVDGAAQGTNGLSGTINNAVDKRVFDQLRALADAVVVGAGTARAEGYAPEALPTVVVTGSGRVPEAFVGAAPGRLLLVTCAAAAGLDAARELVGEDDLLVVGDDAVDLSAMLTALRDRGLADLVCEGGPSLAHALLAAGLVDELCSTTVPHLVAGDRLRITAGPDLDVPLRLATLVEEDGTLLARWLVGR
jgi:riboflavin biosynthesis pyrimidine reductase